MLLASRRANQLTSFTSHTHSPHSSASMMRPRVKQLVVCWRVRAPVLLVRLLLPIPDPFYRLNLFPAILRRSRNSERLRGKVGKWGNATDVSRDVSAKQTRSPRKLSRELVWFAWIPGTLRKQRPCWLLHRKKQIPKQFVYQIYPKLINMLIKTMSVFQNDGGQIRWRRTDNTNKATENRRTWMNRGKVIMIKRSQIYFHMLGNWHHTEIEHLYF